MSPSTPRFFASYPSHPAEAPTIGSYLRQRLEEVGVKHYFGVPGDLNFGLLDELEKSKTMNYIGAPNELTAGYAADGYSRAISAEEAFIQRTASNSAPRAPLAAVIVTYTVGTLGLMNALGASYSEGLPVLFISGSINSNEIGSGRVEHHGLGTPGFYDQALRAIGHLTCWAGRIE